MDRWHYPWEGWLSQQPHIGRSPGTRLELYHGNAIVSIWFQAFFACIFGLLPTPSSERAGAVCVGVHGLRSNCVWGDPYPPACSRRGLCAPDFLLSGIFPAVIDHPCKVSVSFETVGSYRFSDISGNGQATGGKKKNGFRP